MVKPLASVILYFVLEVDETYDIDVADAALSRPEAYHLLDSIASNIEKFKDLGLSNYLSPTTCTFHSQISGTVQLNRFVDDIVDFCTSLKSGSINKSAIKSALTNLLKTEIREERSSIDRREKFIIFSNSQSECGILILHFTGNRIETQNCCSNTADTTIHVTKESLMLLNTADLLIKLRTLIRTQREC